MGQTLSHGVYLPNEGERNCYAGLASNWQILNTAVGNIAEKAPLVHTHGNITNDGKVGTTANLPLITGTGGAITAGAFGNQANTFCEGNDSRLSDARTPLSHTHTKSDVTDLLNSNFIPSANNAYDLGSSSYQWNNVYAKSYYYNGVAWGLDKNNWWSLAQFYSQNSIHVRNVEPGVAPSSDVSAGIRFENANASYVFADIVGKVFTSGTTFVNLIASNKFTNGALDPNGTNVSRGFQIGVRSNGTGFLYTDCGWRCNLVPPLAESGVYSLGTSTAKWKTLNGVNPGALSLPSATAENIDTTNWNFSWNANTVTAPFDGYISIACFGSALQINNETKSYAMTFAPGTDGFICGLLPVSSGDSIKVLVTRTQTSIYEGYKFIKSLGNVS